MRIRHEKLTKLVGIGVHGGEMFRRRLPLNAKWLELRDVSSRFIAAASELSSDEEFDLPVQFLNQDFLFEFLDEVQGVELSSTYPSWFFFLIDPLDFMIEVEETSRFMERRENCNIRTGVPVKFRFQGHAWGEAHNSKNSNGFEVKQSKNLMFLKNCCRKDDA